MKNQLKQKEMKKRNQNKTSKGNRGKLRKHCQIPNLPVQPVYTASFSWRRRSWEKMPCTQTVLVDLGGPSSWHRSLGFGHMTKKKKSKGKQQKTNEKKNKEEPWKTKENEGTTRKAQEKRSMKEKQWKQQKSNWKSTKGQKDSKQNIQRITKVQGKPR